MYLERKIDKFLTKWKANPDVATTLKSFQIDGRYDVICSGSMLGINYKKIHSNSMWYKTDYEMFSMDFEEFLLNFALRYRTPQVRNCVSFLRTRLP